jgi:hypothetical protein
VQGVLLGSIAIALINRNRRFLVGQQVARKVRQATLQGLCWTCPRSCASPTCGWSSSVRGSSPCWPTCTLSGDEAEPHLAVRTRDLEARVSISPAVVDTTLCLSAPDEPSLVV